MEILGYREGNALPAEYVTKDFCSVHVQEIMVSLSKLDTKLGIYLDQLMAQVKENDLRLGQLDSKVNVLEKNAAIIEDRQKMSDKRNAKLIAITGAVIGIVSVAVNVGFRFIG